MEKPLNKLSFLDGYWTSLSVEDFSAKTFQLRVLSMLPELQVNRPLSLIDAFLLVRCYWYYCSISQARSYQPILEQLPEFDLTAPSIIFDDLIP